MSMKVLVIGAAGRTGRHAVRMLLERGDNVTAFVRNPSAITERSDRLRVFHGDARDSAAIDRAVQSQDAVLSALGGGPLRKSDLQEAFMRNLVTAMTMRGVRRLVNLSAWGSGGASVPPANLFARYFFLPIVLRHVLADKRRGQSNVTIQKRRRVVRARTEETFDRCCRSTGRDVLWPGTTIAFGSPTYSPTVLR
jgi:NAD(P)-dependent dehydrogenase (short-subunit alcohol dehydrogenase family)